MKKIFTLLALAFCLNGWAQCVTPSTPTILGANSFYYCQGATINPINATGSDIIVWYSDASLTNVVNIGNSYTPTNLPIGTITLYLIDSAAAGCKSLGTATVNITVNPSPPAPILTGVSSNPLTECQGSPSAALSVSSFSGLVPVWYNGTNFLSAGTSYFTNTSLAGTTVYTVYDSSFVNGCTGAIDFNILTVTVTVNPSPSVTYTLIQDAAPHTWDIYATYSPPNLTVTWDWGDGSTTNGLYPSHTYSVAGKYYICVNASINGNCNTVTCQNDSVYRLAYNSVNSSMVYVNVYNGLSGINQLAVNNEQVTLYPNPSNGIIQLAVDNVRLKELKVYDITGKLAYSQPTPNPSKDGNNITVDLSNLQNGIYNLSIISNGGVVNKRVVISH